MLTRMFGCFRKPQIVEETASSNNGQNKQADASTSSNVGPEQIDKMIKQVEQLAAYGRHAEANKKAGEVIAPPLSACCYDSLNPDVLAAPRTDSKW